MKRLHRVAMERDIVVSITVIIMAAVIQVGTPVTTQVAVQDNV
jgi:hypothetical protein